MALSRLRIPPGADPDSRHPVQASGAGRSDVPGGGEATGLDRRSAPVRVSERQPGLGEEPLRAGPPHAADQQPAPARLDLPLQLRSEFIHLCCIPGILVGLAGLAADFWHSFSFLRAAASLGWEKMK